MVLVPGVSLGLGLGVLTCVQVAADTTAVDLLTGANVHIDGAAGGDLSGFSVAGAGDVNGDGRADVIIGARAADNNSRTESGSSYVVFGQPSLAGVDLNALGMAGFRIDGAAANNRSGFSVAGAGDINGDGRADVIVGAPGAGNNSRNFSGSTYVVFGRTATTTVDLGTLGTGGFRIDGAATNDLSGWSVAGAGDINGDGRADLILGAPEADNNSRTSSGSSYVVFGRTGTTTVDLTALGTAGFRIDGAATGDGSGWSVAGAGDINGDGRADLIIGAPEADNNSRTSSGSSYVVFGRTATTTVDLTALGTAGFRIDGAATSDLSGRSVAGAGDINGDGRADLIIGAQGADNNSRTYSGSSYVVFGRTATTTVDLTALGTAGFRIDGAATSDASGRSVAGAGDINGDGRADLIIGAPGANNNSRTDSGSSYVVFGRTATTTVDLTALGTAGFRIDGAATGDFSGWSVAGAGDVNGDGGADVLVGAYGADNNTRTTSGSSYVVFGTPPPTPPPSTPPPPVVTAMQTAVVKVPKRLKAKGATVVLKKAVVTNAGQKATSRLTWSTKKSAKGAKKKYATVRTKRSGKVTITTTGKARKLYVKLRLKAPATAGYTAYSYTTTWTVKKRK